MTTISDEHCSDTMREVLSSSHIPAEFDDNIPVLSADNMPNSVLYFLTDDDKFLLEEFAPKLFNTILEPKHLEEYMYKLAMLLDVFRGAKIMKEVGDERFNKTKYNKSNPKEREKHYLDAIDEVLSVINSPSPPPMYPEDIERKRKLTKELKHFRDNYKRYIPTKPNVGNLSKKDDVAISKAPIKKYLIELSLPHKTSEISSFISSIS